MMLDSTYIDAAAELQCSQNTKGLIKIFILLFFFSVFETSQSVTFSAFNLF